MTADGYCNERTESFKQRSDDQLKLNARLREIAHEMAELPQVPSSMESWVGSWSNLDKKTFGMDTFSKHLKIKKEYVKLVDTADSNLREMKILAIDDLLEKINNTLNNSD